MGRTRTRLVALLGILLGSWLSSAAAQAQPCLASVAMVAIARTDVAPRVQIAPVRWVERDRTPATDLQAIRRPDLARPGQLPNQWLWDSLGSAADDASPRHQMNGVSARISPTVTSGLSDRAVTGVGVVGHF